MSPVAALPQHKRIVLSAEQEAVLKWSTDNTGSAIIEAVAGSGKTFVLEQVAPLLTGTSAYAVFNKKNSDEAKRKMGHVDGLSIGTCHSFGFGAWRGHMDRVQVKAWDKRKMMLEENDVPEALGSAVTKMVSLAKQTMGGTIWSLDDTDAWVELIEHYGVMWQVEADGRPQEVIMAQLIGLARRCVEWSIDMGSIIDFDDMIWLPLHHRVPIKQYDWVLLDEAQDLNVSRRILAERMLKPGGRLIAVGDRNQAIYGFSGADSDSLDNIAAHHECHSLPLSTTYRCSKSATTLAQKFVPHIEAFEDNEEGSVVNASFRLFWQKYVTAGKDADLIEQGIDELEDAGRRIAHKDQAEYLRGALLSPGDAILCRMTRPLVTLAFRLIREGVGCYVEGRDIGKQLERMATKWKVKTVKELTANLEGYRQHEMVRLLARKAEGAIAALNDRVETLHIIMEGCELVSEVVAKINSLFQDSGDGTPSTVVLSTIHKAKGREWDRVFVLGWNEYMPSKWAKQEWEKRQERHLQYVAVTRTKRDLILISEGV